MPETSSSGLSCACAACFACFTLTAEDDVEDSPRVGRLCVRSCESGGIFAIYVDCPRCSHRHDLY